MLALVGAALWTLRDNLPSILAVARSTRPRWVLVALASGLTLLTYVLLIESWRRVLGTVGGQLSPFDAAVIWLGSNLARYLPGTGWQLGLMGVMARERGVTLVMSTSASILVTIASTLTGVAICLAGLATLAATPGTIPALSNATLVVAGVSVVALACGPWFLPRLARTLSRLTGREIMLPRLSLRSVTIAACGTAVAWIAYGVAFWLLARAVLPTGTTRSLAGCITLYTFSYLVGWFNPMPAGIGVTEPVIVLLAPQFGVATTAEAAVLALFVRAWRTVMETVPNLAVVAVDAVKRRRAVRS